MANAGGGDIYPKSGGPQISGFWKMPKIGGPENGEFQNHQNNPFSGPQKTTFF